MKTTTRRFARCGSSLLLALAFILSSGCGRKAPDLAAHAKAIRARYAEFIKVLCAENYAACLALTDPAAFQGKGVETVSDAYKRLGGLIKAANLKPEDVRIDNVAFNEDYAACQVYTSISMKGEWKQQTPSQWVRSKDQWFLVPAL